MRFLTVVLAVTAIVFLLSVQPHNASGVPNGEKNEWKKKRINIFLQSLQANPVSPSTPNSRQRPALHHWPELCKPCRASPRPSPPATIAVVMATEHK